MPNISDPQVSCAKLLPETDFLFTCTDLLNTYIYFSIIGFILVLIAIGYSDLSLHSHTDLLKKVVLMF